MASLVVCGMASLLRNNGGWYAFGFLIGVGSLGFGGHKASR